MNKILTKNLVGGAVLALFAMMFITYENLPIEANLKIVAIFSCVAIIVKGLRVRKHLYEYREKELIKTLILLFIGCVCAAFAVATTNISGTVVLAPIALTIANDEL